MHGFCRREEGLNKREINVGEAQQEVRAKADILEGLKEEFKQREEKFDQWEKMCKYDLAKRKDATTKKETELYQRIETFEVKEKEISVQITEFQKRYTRWSQKFNSCLSTTKIDRQCGKNLLLQ